MSSACVIGSCYDRVGGPPGLAGAAIDHATSLAEAGWRVDVVTRVGLDASGDAARAYWRKAGVDDSRVQTDPDLGTGRWWPRRRGTDLPWIESGAAFDNLQWDGDLASAAASAALLVSDLTGRRNAQARSTIDRVLVEAPAALRVLDLTGAGVAEVATDSAPLRSGLDHAELVVVDAPGLHRAGLAEDGSTASLRRRFRGTVLVWSPGEPIRIETSDGEAAGTTPLPAERHPASAFAAILRSEGGGSDVIAEIERRFDEARR